MVVGFKLKKNSPDHETMSRMSRNVHFKTFNYIYKIKPHWWCNG